MVNLNLTMDMLNLEIVKDIINVVRELTEDERIDINTRKEYKEKMLRISSNYDIKIKREAENKAIIKNINGDVVGEF